MKQLNHLLLMAALTLMPGTTFAQSSNPDDWNFNTNFTMDETIYNVDTTNGVAQFSAINTPVRRLEIPASVKYEGKDYPVVSLANHWGYNKEGIEEIIIPSSMKHIARNGLSGFPDLETLDVPSSVTYLEAEAFADNASLTSLTLRAEKFEKIESSIFNNHCGELHVYMPNCKQATSVAGDYNNDCITWTRDYTGRAVWVHVPKGSINSYRLANGWSHYICLIDGDGNKVNITNHKPGALASEVLKQCDYVAEVNELTVSGGDFNEADWNAIKEMEHLVRFDIGDTAIKDIPANALQQHYGMTTLVLPKELGTIGEYAFNFTGIETVDFPSTLTAIRSFAFEDDYRLQRIDIPGNVETIGSYAFRDTRHAKTLSLHEGLKHIAYAAFYNCISIKSVKLPSTVKFLDEAAFGKCTALEQVELNEGLLETKYSVFQGCSSLRSITLPSSLVMMIGNPLQKCDNLLDVTCLSIVPPTTNGDFPSSDMTGRTLRVPSAAVQNYKQAEGWKRFPSILGIDDLPESINVMGERQLTLPASLPSDYRPNMLLAHGQFSRSDARDWRNKSGQLVLNATTSLNLSDFQMVTSSRNIDDAATSIIPLGKELRTAKGSFYYQFDSQAWNFICFPCDVRVNDITPTDPSQTINFSIMRYDPAKRAAGQGKDAWVRLGLGDVMKAGEGYIINPSCYSYNDFYDEYNRIDSHLTFPAASNFVLTTNDVKIPLASTPAEFAHNAHWNFLGNPFTAYYELNKITPATVVTLWDPFTKNYVAINTADDNYVLYPGESFFVQGTTQGTTITLPADGRRTFGDVQESLKAPRRNEVRSERQLLNLTLSDGTNTDHTRVVINPAATMEYEIGRDAAKFASLDVAAPQISTLCGDTEYAINERPLADGRVLLGVSCNTAQAELSIDADIEGYTLFIYNGEDYVPFGLNLPFTFRPAEHAQLVLCIADSATSLQTLKQDAALSLAPIYGIDGRRTNMQCPGVYVVGSRKVIK